MVAFSMLATSVAVAQVQFDELRMRHLPHDRASTTAAVLGDLDGDGDLDLVFGNSYDEDRLHLNDGRGTFVDATAGRLPADRASTMDIALGDVDGDGDVDLVFANFGGSRLFLNDGTGRFTDATASHLPSSSHSGGVALGDVDRDGDPDLVFANDGQNSLYLNDGTGRFTDATRARMPVGVDRSSDVALGDLDGDGSPDLVFANQDEQNRLYLNDGSGRFVDVTAARMPIDGDRSLGTALCDVDGDGDLDVVFASWEQQNRLYLNDGAARFSDVTAARLPADAAFSSTAQPCDIDGDRDLDLLFGNWIDPTSLYLNDGRGSFTDATAARLPFEGSGTSAIPVGDVDGDGDPDLVLGNGNQNRLFLNDGLGRFLDGTATGLPSDGGHARGAALGDVDGDGDPDLVVGNVRVFSQPKPNRLYLNDGTGTYTDASATRLAADTDDTAAVALGDVDGDGDADLIFGNLRTRNRLHLNDGRGTFTDVTIGRMPDGGYVTNAVALGDVDGDGDPDLVFGNSGQSRLHLNDGSGTFTDATAARLPARIEITRGLALGDVDGDSDLDLVLGNCGQSWLYLNDGRGTFSDGTAGRLPAADRGTTSVALGDVDGDGDPDLVLGNGDFNSERLSLYLNDASGTFTDVSAARLPPGTHKTNTVVLSDVDEDGDLDLLVGSYTGGGNLLYLNNGAGVFSDATVASRVSTTFGSCYAVLPGDVDGDGDVDLVFANGFDENQLYLNLLRQLATPFLVFPGRDYRLEVHARDGVPRQLDVAVPFLSTAPAHIPVPPFGTFGLDPNLAVVWPAIVVPQPNGVGVLSVRVPNDPGLIGVTGYAQALLLQLPSLALLTNVTADRVAR